MAEGLVTNPDDLTRYNGYMVNVRTRHLSSTAIARAMVWEGVKLYLDPRVAIRSRFVRDYPAFRGAMMRNNLALFGGLRNPMFHSTHTLWPAIACAPGSCSRCSPRRPLGRAPAGIRRCG